MITENRMSAVYTDTDGSHYQTAVMAWADNGLAMVALREGSLGVANQQPGYLGLWDHTLECTGGQYDAGFKRVFGVVGVFRGINKFMKVKSCL